MHHIDLPTRAQIDQIAAYRGSPAVSIYLRTTPVTQDTKGDRIELRNLLKTAVAQMEAAAVSKQAIGSIVDGVEPLVEDDDFWATQANSLAVFATPDTVKTFRLPNKLGNIVEVSDRFHIKPLLRAATFPHQAYVLAIGVGAVRFVEISPDLPPHELSVPGLPRDFNQALKRRSHIERDGDMRSGEGTSEHAMLTRYARTVDRALRPLLAGDERPVIVAAVEPLASIYRSVSSYPHVAKAVIPGSADHTPDHVLAAAARDVLDGIYSEDIRVLRELYATRAAQGRATADIAQAARAATYGAVDTLVVDIETVVPGLVGEEDGAVTFSDGPNAATYGVVDEIARRVLRTGGRVIAARRADVPLGGNLAALLRYPV
jgi:hypothetical protein